MYTSHVDLSISELANAAAESIAHAGVAYVARSGGHPDEAAALMADPDNVMSPSDLTEGLAEWELDQAIQRADERATADLRDIVRRAKAMFGATTGIRANRTASVDSATGPCLMYSISVFPGADMPTDQCFVTTGAGRSPSEALADLIVQFDKDFAITVTAAGCRVEGLATVVAIPYRTAAQAQDFARRIAADFIYLDVALSYRIPGIIDHRDDRPAATAAA